MTDMFVMLCCEHMLCETMYWQWEENYKTDKIKQKLQENEQSVNKLFRY